MSTDISLNTAFRLCLVLSPVHHSPIYPKELLYHPKRADFSLQPFRRAFELLPPLILTF